MGSAETEAVVAPPPSYQLATDETSTINTKTVVPAVNNNNGNNNSDGTAESGKSAPPVDRGGDGSSSSHYLIPVEAVQQQQQQQLTRPTGSNTTMTTKREELNKFAKAPGSPQIWKKEEDPDCILYDIWSSFGLEMESTESISTFVDVLEESGLSEKLIKDFDFLKVKSLKSDVIERAFLGQLIIPDWQAFTNYLDDIYEKVEENKEGHVATYIPQLARVDAEQYAACFVSIDGQVWSRGDDEVEFSVQSCSKPYTFCMATEDPLIAEENIDLSKHVGHEPSGREFNAFILDKHNRPHNPMINSGAIMTAALMRMSCEQSERFDYARNIWAKMAKGAGGKIGFDNSSFLSELGHADGNFALAYMMKNAQCFPKVKTRDMNHVKTRDMNHDEFNAHLRFYLMLCSILADTRQMAGVGAVMANGGVNAFTKERIFKTPTVRDCLSLMYSCGMYDYSGEFAYSVGLPAKSGVSGIVQVVIPGVGCLAVWSPRLDEQGNSAKGVEFSKRLVDIFNFHLFDGFATADRMAKCSKLDPRFKLSVDREINSICELNFAAAKGDMTRLRQLVMQGTPINIGDYDKRTPLHLAAAEENVAIVEYLVAKGARIDVEDRWKTTAVDEAVKTGNKEIIAILNKYN